MGEFMLTIADAASAGVAFTGAPFAFRVIDFYVITTGDPGANANTYQLQTAAGAANVSNAVGTNGVGDNAIVRCGTIDDANHEFAAGVDLQIDRVKVGGVASVIACIVYMRI